MRRFQHHIDPPAQVAKRRPSVPLQRRHHFDHTGFFQHAAPLARAHHVGQIVDAAGRKLQAIGGHVEAGGVGDRRHLDGGFGAVEKRVEHLRIHAGGLRLGGAETIMVPDPGRRHVVIGRQIFGALARGDDTESDRARPVHHFRGQGRLIAIGERIHHPGAAGLVGQQRSGQHVGLDIDHDDVLAGSDRRAGMADSHGRIAGGFHDHFDVAAGRGG